LYFLKFIVILLINLGNRREEQGRERGGWGESGSDNSDNNDCEGTDHGKRG